MLFLRCGEEAHYQWPLNRLLEALHSMHGDRKAPFPLPVPFIPEALTMAFDDLKKIFTSMGILEPTGILKALRAAQSWMRRASRCQSLVQRNKEVQDALVTILKDNYKVLSERVATDLYNSFGLNLSYTEYSDGA